MSSIGDRLLNISKGKKNNNTITNTITQQQQKKEEQQKDELNFPMKTHREPKVVVFEEPGRKKRTTADGTLV